MSLQLKTAYSSYTVPLLLISPLPLYLCSPGVSYSYLQGQPLAEEDVAVDVKLYSHRWRRWLSPEQPHNMDSNRASQDQDQQDQDQSQDQPEGNFPGLLSAEDSQDTDNSSQIEVQ